VPIGKDAVAHSQALGPSAVASAGLLKMFAVCPAEEWSYPFAAVHGYCVFRAAYPFGDENTAKTLFGSAAVPPQ
jgi:hypothetical protein